MIATVQRRSPQRPIAFVNTSSEDAPPYAAMEVLDVDYDYVHYVRKPETDDLPPQKVLINGHVTSKAGKSGVGQGSYPYRARYELDDGPAANRDTVGTRAGYWELYQGYEGFIVRGHPDESIEQIIVQPDMTCRQAGGPNAYYPNDDPCAATCCCWTCGPTAFTDPNNVAGFTGPTSLRVTVSSSCIGTHSVNCALASCGCTDPGSRSDVITWTGDTGDGVFGTGTSCVDGSPALWIGPSLSVSIVCTSAGLAGRLFYIAFMHRSSTGLVGSNGSNFFTSCRLTDPFFSGYVMGGYTPLRFMCDPFFAFVSGAAVCVPSASGIVTSVTACVGASVLALVTI